MILLPSKKQQREWRRRKLSESAYSQGPLVNGRFIMDEERLAENEKRRAQVEKLLGPVKSAPGAPTYVVRLGDTLRSIATKHPALNDVKLWKLLAEKNNLSTSCDAKGNPKAILQRGSKLLLPTVKEIADFRKGLKAAPVATPDLSSVATVLEPVSKECGFCRRLTTLSSTVCPACGFSFEVAEAVTAHGQRHHTHRHGRRQPSRFRRKLLILLGPETLVDSRRLPAPRLDVRTDDNTSILGSDDVTTNVSFNAEPSVAAPASRPAVSEIEVERHVEQLSDSCRLVRTVVRRNGVEIASEHNFDGRKNDMWNVILFYELSEEGSVRQKHFRQAVC